MIIDSFSYYISVYKKLFFNYCVEQTAEHKLTHGQLFILTYIGKKNECSPKEIAEVFKLDAGQLNRTLARLIDRDFINQRKNELDRRSNVLSLTEKGYTIYQKCYELFYSFDDKLLCCLNENERKTLITLMNKIYDQLVANGVVIDE